MRKVNITELKYQISRGGLIKELYQHPYPFFLESRMADTRLTGNPVGQERFGRFSFYGADPFLVLKSKGSHITINKGKRVFTKRGDPFLALRQILKSCRVTPNKYPVPFVGGGVGYLGYDLCHFVEKLPRTTKDDLGFPDMFFAFYDRVIAVDHIKKKNYLISLNSVKSVESVLAEGGFASDRKSVKLTSNPPAKVVRRTGFSKRNYLKAVRRIKEYIAAGDIYQVNLSQRFSTGFSGSPLQLYQRLTQINPAPFSAFLQPEPDKFIISSSPERFLLVRDGRIETRPIKGTRPRGRTKQTDNRLKRELYQSEKDNAELAMIVDLERNDLGRVCRYGSVKVTERKVLKSYPTVHHLVATVKGELAPKYDRVDLLKASFPGGSITGAPKIRAMEIIDELEPTARGPYTGAIGWLGFDGSMDLSIAIRILLLVQTPNQTINRVYYQVGGGIVADSDPEAEYQETLDKGRALEKALLEL